MIVSCDGVVIIIDFLVNQQDNSSYEINISTQVNYWIFSVSIGILFSNFIYLFIYLFLLGISVVINSPNFKIEIEKSTTI